MNKTLLILSLLYFSCSIALNQKPATETPGNPSSDLPQLLHNIELKWMPTETITSTDSTKLKTLGKHTFKINTFSDCRENSAEIGKNVEKESAKTVSTSTDIGAWCSDCFGVKLRDCGISVITDSANFTIDGCVNKFYVTEGKMYSGEIEIAFTVTNTTSNEKWSTVISGGYELWGKSYKADNYVQCFSNSLMIIIDSFLSNPKFSQER
ncbi:MAG: hypothetical protein L0Y76_11250 [Ignavibacteria bacterium]|nr:hypothetical protein [Ignavibacteria bacterium]